MHSSGQWFRHPHSAVFAGLVPLVCRLACVDVLSNTLHWKCGRAADSFKPALFHPRVLAIIAALAVSSSTPLSVLQAFENRQSLPLLRKCFGRNAFRHCFVSRVAFGAPLAISCVTLIQTRIFFYETKGEGMRANVSPTTIRNLVAADGYLDLNMPEYALRELEKMGDAGLYEPPRQYLIGCALKMMDRLDDAIRPLEEAARRMPAPIRRLAWAELTECYRHLGSEELAQIAESLAGPAEEGQGYKLVLPEVEITLDERELLF